MEELNVVSMQDAAKILHISRTTLWRYIKDGKISALKYSTKKVLIRAFRKINYRLMLKHLDIY
jgi:excisionase family DNA binding protein